MNLNWQYVTDPRDPKFKVKGTRIAQAVCGFRSRFAIVELRTYDFGVVYGIADAETVSDADVKAGVRPRIVKWFDNLEDAVAAVERASEKLQKEFDEMG